MKSILKFIFIFLLSFVLLAVPRIGGYVANLFDYDLIDPDGAFMWISVHHVIQALIILLIIVLLIKFLKIKFHLGFGDRSEGKKHLKRFFLFFTIYTVVGFIFTILFGEFQPFAYPLNARNIIGYMGFQLFLSGPSEELVFRAFAISLFAFFVTDKRLNKNFSYAVIFAAIIFGLAHVNFSFNPFVISYSIYQVVYAVVLGYFYGICYEKSKSIIYPMIMHSFSNVLMIGLTIILSFFL